MKIKEPSIWFYCLIAYLFSIACRLIWVVQFQDVESFYWNDQLMINTNDGYYFATLAKNILEGIQLESADTNIAWQYGTVVLTIIVAKMTSLPFEAIILYMPAVISSLVVIPIIFLGKLFENPFWGFLSALLASIAWSYYNRTMVGYYDTDMFSVMVSMFIVYFLIASIINTNLYHTLIGVYLIIMYPFFYDSGLSIVYAMGTIYICFILIFNRKEIWGYQSIILITIVLSSLPDVAKAISVSIAFISFRYVSFALKKWIILALFGLVLFLATNPMFSIVLGKVIMYTQRSVESEGLKFFQVIQTVREAGQIPFETMANRIVGSTIGVLLSFFGYVLLVLKHRPFILALPLIGIGVFSLWGGLRFTVYAVPIAAMSAVYLFYVITSFFQKQWLKYSFIILATALMLYPNIIHIIGYRVPTVFNKQEVQVLDQLKKVSSPKDYTIAWWDYGYPIWYYSNTNTLIDGGKHHHDNFIVSKILNTSSQTLAANLSRLAVETYVQSDYKIVADTLFKNKQKDQIDPNSFLEELQKEDYLVPPRTRDVYIYLPYRMMNIFPTVSMFSNLDLQTGKKGQRPFFFSSQSIQKEGDFIHLGNGVALNQKKAQIKIGDKNLLIDKFTIVKNEKSGKLLRQTQVLNSTAALSVIYMQSYNTFLVLDNAMYGSLFIQLFVLENYDKNLFEPVVLSPHAKVYKVKK